MKLFSKPRRTLEAFTLVELLISITIFSLFIGVIMTVVLTFHGAQEDAILRRRMLFEMQDIYTRMSHDLLDYALDYTYYEDASFTTSTTDFFGGITNVLRTDTLVLQSLDGTERVIYEWDADEEMLTVQRFDLSEDGTAIPQAGYSSALPMNSENIQVSSLQFRIFPPENPFSPEHLNDTELAFQPTVQIQITMQAEGRLQDLIELDLQTSITSRYLQ